MVNIRKPIDFEDLENHLLNGGTLGDYSLKAKKAGMQKRLREQADPETYEKLCALSRENAKIKRFKERIRGIPVLRMIEDGRSVKSITEEFEIAPQTLNKIVKKLYPEKYPILLDNGKISQSNSNRKLTPQNLREIHNLSEKGFGIDYIGSIFGVDGTTIRHVLIRDLGEKEYKKRHPKTRYTQNKGWNGKSITYNNHNYQSRFEVIIAKELDSLEVGYKPHCTLKLGEKVFYPDFYLPKYDLYIEYAGMMDRSFYRKSFAEKMNHYSAHNITFLLVFPETIEDFRNTIKELIHSVA